MAQEARVRADPNLRADRFVERWQGLKQERDRLYRAGDMAGRERTGKEMAGMAKSLERDPQVELVLRNRTRELGLEIGMGRGRGMNSGDLGRELGRDLGIGMGRGRAEEQTSEVQSLMRSSYAGVCLKKQIRQKSPR